MSTGQGTAKLVYCVIDGQIRHVGEFWHLPSKARPTATCPECHKTVVMKLGSVVTHHVAHKPNAICVVTKPETALHLNCKIHIHRELQRGCALYITQRCDGWLAPKVGDYGGGRMACRASRPFLWLESWDRVEMEQYVGSRKPDIVFYRDGRPVAAIEIYATHAVDELKRADLRAMGIPWLEVKADEFLYESDELDEGPWRIGQPLPYNNSDSPVPAWVCEHCLDAPSKFVARVEAQIAAEEQKAAAKLAEIRKYDGVENRVIKAKAIYLFRDDGLYEPHQLLVFERTSRHSSTEVAAIYLRDGEKGRVLAEEVAPITEQSRTNIREAYKQWRKLFSGSYILVNITGWVSYEEMRDRLSQWKSPYYYDERRQRWVERLQQ